MVVAVFSDYSCIHLSRIQTRKGGGGLLGGSPATPYKSPKPHWSTSQRRSSHFTPHVVERRWRHVLVVHDVQLAANESGRRSRFARSEWPEPVVRSGPHAPRSWTYFCIGDVMCTRCASAADEWKRSARHAGDVSWCRSNQKGGSARCHGHRRL